MLQDIYPHHYNVTYTPAHPYPDDIMLIYQNDSLLTEQKKYSVEFPRFKSLLKFPKNLVSNIIFLFQIDDCRYYTIIGEEILPFTPYTYEKIEVIRNQAEDWKAFAVITGNQIYRWMNKNNFCSVCGSKITFCENERALKCINCSNVIYPHLSPSIIAGIVHNGKILLTKYASTHSSYKNYSLVAGYVEVGETLEDTVRREVFEEVGLKIKNITYYHSQPWAFTNTLLIGFFCEVEGNPDITLEIDELSEAEWFLPSEIPPFTSTASLTNDMIKYFQKNGFSTLFH